MRPGVGACFPLLTGALLLAAGVAKSEDIRPQVFEGSFQLAEIVVPTQPDSSQKARKSASEVRSKAKGYQESSSSGTPTVVIVPEEEEDGLLGSRRAPESRAAENRNKARQYQQGEAGASVPVPLGRDSPSQTTAERASDNRAKARSYVSTDNTVMIERIGSDGIPIVSCGKLVSNVAGRIGDDMQPGGIFFIMRDNKPFKVRCALQ